MSDGALVSALAVALGTGIATFFSPCAYPLLPGYVAYYAGQADGTEPSVGGAVVRGLVAGGGVVLALGALVGVAFWIGQGTLASITLLEPVIGAILVGFGLLFVFDRAPSLSVSLPRRRSGVLGFGIFGAGYALASAGCVIPAFLTVIAYALTFSPAQGALVLSTYAGSVAILMVATTVAAGAGLLAGGTTLSAYTGSIKRAAGVIMILAGLGQLYLSIFVLEVL